MTYWSHLWICPAENGGSSHDDGPRSRMKGKRSEASMRFDWLSSDNGCSERLTRKMSRKICAPTRP